VVFLIRWIAGFVPQRIPMYWNVQTLARKTSVIVCLHRYVILSVGVDLPFDLLLDGRYDRLLIGPLNALQCVF
jgi:hypothetical protein